jgi:MarR family transcriptional regulator, organic hydroperoxide resistance regulator
MTENIINELGALAIGARMRRMIDLFAKDVERIYAENGLEFETKYFALFYLLSRRGNCSIMEIAKELGLTHPAIIDLARGLEKKGYIESVKSPSDLRKRILRISKKGKTTLPAFESVWAKISRLNKQLMEGQQHNLLKALEELEAILDEKSYYKRYNKLK